MENQLIQGKLQNQTYCKGKRHLGITIKESKSLEANFRIDSIGIKKVLMRLGNQFWVNNPILKIAIMK